MIKYSQKNFTSQSVHLKWYIPGSLHFQQKKRIGQLRKDNIRNITEEPEAIKHVSSTNETHLN